MKGETVMGVFSVPVTIGGTTYIPPIPIEFVIKERIDEILNKNAEMVDIAIELCLYCMKTQIFNDGNKRVSVIFANHFLISKGAGLLVIPENKATEFKKLLVAYYEDRDNGEILEFMKKYCWVTSLRNLICRLNISAVFSKNISIKPL